MFIFNPRTNALFVQSINTWIPIVPGFVFIYIISSSGQKTLEFSWEKFPQSEDVATVPVKEWPSVKYWNSTSQFTQHFTNITPINLHDCLAGGTISTLDRQGDKVTCLAQGHTGSQKPN